MTRAERYLERIKMIDALIRNKKREYMNYVNAADGMGGGSSGDRVQSSRNLHRGADMICSYVDIENEIRTLEHEKNDIIRTLEKLPCEDYDILHKLYVQYVSPKDIAFEYGMSYEWVKWRRKHALSILERLLEEQALP